MIEFPCPATIFTHSDVYGRSSKQPIPRAKVRANKTLEGASWLHNFLGTAGMPTGASSLQPQKVQEPHHLLTSSTLDLPQLWSPMTAICGRGRSWEIPCARSSSTRSSHGRTSLCARGRNRLKQNPKQTKRLAVIRRRFGHCRLQLSLCVCKVRNNVVRCLEGRDRSPGMTCPRLYADLLCARCLWRGAWCSAWSPGSLPLSLHLDQKPFENSHSIPSQHLVVGRRFRSLYTSHGATAISA